MDTLFHFSIVLFALVPLGLHKKYGWKVVLALAFTAILVDLDHFMMKDFKPLHNVFFMILLPLILFLIFYKLKNEKLQIFALLVLIVLSSHLAIDFFYAPLRGAPLLFPFSATEYRFPQFTWEVPQGDIFSPRSLALVSGFSILMLAGFVDKFIHAIRKQRVATPLSEIL